MFIWGFENNDRKVYRQYDMHMQINQIRVLGDNLFFVYPSGETRLFRWDSERNDLVTKFVPAHFDEEDNEPTIKDIFMDVLEAVRVGEERKYTDTSKLLV